MDDARYAQLLDKIDQLNLHLLLSFVFTTVLIFTVLVLVLLLIYDRFKRQERNETSSFAIKRDAKGRQAWYPKSKSVTIATAGTMPSYFNNNNNNNEDLVYPYMSSSQQPTTISRELTNSSNRYMMPASAIYNVNEQAGKYAAKSSVIKSHSDPMTAKQQSPTIDTMFTRRRNQNKIVRRSRSWDFNNNSYSISSSVNGFKTTFESKIKECSTHELIPQQVRSRLMPVTTSSSDENNRTLPAGENNKHQPASITTTEDDVFSS